MPIEHRKTQGRSGNPERTPGAFNGMASWRTVLIEWSGEASSPCHAGFDAALFHSTAQRPGLGLGSVREGRRFDRTSSGSKATAT